MDPADDPAHFEEEVEANLEDASLARKGRVKTDGYDSDSSDDGEGVVRSRKTEKEDDDEDMFAMGDDSNKKEDEDGAKKKKEAYLRLGDIEGQEFGGSGSEGESDEEEGEPEDEDDAERRAKAGNGFELTHFNMRDEMEEGKFTEDGSYVRTFDPHAIHDRWMDGIESKEIKAARRRKREHDRSQKEKAEAEARELEESGGEPALARDLLPYLKKGESILEALQRLGMQAKKQKGKQASSSTEVDTITHLASQLMALGDTDIYSRTYEELVRSVRSSKLVDSNWEPPSADVKYEYKWDVPGGGQPDQVFGPFGEEEMRSWYKASYFGPTGEKVKVRKVGGDWADWDDVLL